MTQILILDTTLAVVFHVFDINLIWHHPVVANWSQVFSHFINAEVRWHFRVLCSWISTGTVILQKKKKKKSLPPKHPYLRWISSQALTPKHYYFRTYCVISHSVQWPSLFLGPCVHEASPVQIAPEISRISCPTFLTFYFKVLNLDVRILLNVHVSYNVSEVQAACDLNTLRECQM